MNEVKLNQTQINMIKHAWGYNSSDPGYRTHYCTYTDDPDMTVLVEQGFFKGPKYEGQVTDGCAMFYLTEKSILLLKEWQRNEQARSL